MGRRAGGRLRGVGCRLAGPAMSMLLVLATIGDASAVSAAEIAPEYQIKAAFLYKFGSYVEWPKGSSESGQSSFTIAVIGADDLVGYLSRMVKDRMVGGKPVVVRRLRPGAVPAGIQVLFIGRAAQEDTASILASVRNEPVLTVTESSRTESAGGVINFVIVDNRVRFDVALSSARRRNLKISSRLLEVARRVSGRTS
ncbi:MAG: YfiR family protein [Arenicellales bacterium]